MNYFKVDPLRERIFVPSPIVGEDENTENTGTFDFLPRPAKAIIQNIYLFHDDDQAGIEKAWYHVWAKSNGDKLRLSIHHAIGRPGPWHFLAIIGMSATRTPITLQELQRRIELAADAQRRCKDIAPGIMGDGWADRMRLEADAMQAQIDYDWLMAWKRAA